jgi:hypothetical protein
MDAMFAMFFIWAMVAIFSTLIFNFDFKFKKPFIIFQIIWFVIMGLPPLLKLWILGVMS